MIDYEDLFLDRSNGQTSIRDFTPDELEEIKPNFPPEEDENHL